ncbi:hypothetical protein LIA77_10696 [Sarocladium implicatum]|nr:hypothetical protein LIA77_10696 [Sarocladium implicatum]
MAMGLSDRQLCVGSIIPHKAEEAVNHTQYLTWAKRAGLIVWLDSLTQAVANIRCTCIVTTQCREPRQYVQFVRPNSVVRLQSHRHTIDKILLRFPGDFTCCERGCNMRVWGGYEFVDSKAYSCQPPGLRVDFWNHKLLAKEAGSFLLAVSSAEVALTTTAASSSTMQAIPAHLQGSHACHDAEDVLVSEDVSQPDGDLPLLATGLGSIAATLSLGPRVPEQTAALGGQDNTDRRCSTRRGRRGTRRSSSDPDLNLQVSWERFRPIPGFRQNHTSAILLAYSHLPPYYSQAIYGARYTALSLTRPMTNMNVRDVRHRTNTPHQLFTPAAAATATFTPFRGGQGASEERPSGRHFLLKVQSISCGVSKEADYILPRSSASDIAVGWTLPVNAPMSVNPIDWSKVRHSSFYIYRTHVNALVVWTNRCYGKD